GECTLDLDTRELSRGGKIVHVEPKAYRLLEILVAARPKALSKDALQDRLWPNTFVSERSLARLVEVLRGCLGDRARKPRFIRTVHGFGYAFCGEAAEIPGPARSVAGSEFHCRVAWGDREVALTEGENVLGRDPAAVVWIDLKSVSRLHARIVVADGAATIEDLGSRNGTYVDGNRVEAPAKLADGSRIKIGAAKLVFRCFRGLGSTQSEASSEIR
ncbi:MAG: FHA domain-containing protein, partial [Thermoanaerobaculia bacterium]